MTEFPTLVSPRCTMGRVTDEDIPAMREILDDELTKRYLPELKPFTRSNDKIKQLLESFDVLFARNEGIIWGVRSSNTLVGFVAVIDLSVTPTLIYATHPAYREMGFMKECVPLLVSKTFEITECQYIQSEVYNDNKSSIRLLQSIGFCVVNIDRKKTYLKKMKDTIQDWIKLEQKYTPLTERGSAQPSMHGSIEDNVAHQLYNRQSSISLPLKDMICFVMYFICECPDDEWERLKCPYSLFTERRIAPILRKELKENTILGEDVAIIAYSLMRWYGSQNVFRIIRQDYNYDFDNARLFHKNGGRSLL